MPVIRLAHKCMSFLIEGYVIEKYVSLLYIDYVKEPEGIFDKELGIPCPSLESDALQP